MKALLLCAGFGTRFKPQTIFLPKPALPFLGLPMMFYALESTKSIGANEFYINLHHLPDKIKSTVNFFKSEQDKIHFSHEQKILGSAGAIYQLKKQLESDENFILCNGDEILLPKDLTDLEKLISLHKKNGNFATLLTTQHPEAGKKFGAIWSKGSKVYDIGKTPKDTTLKPEHFIGLIVLNKEVLTLVQNIESNILYDILLPQIRLGKSIHTYNIDCQWHETGNELDYLDAHNQILTNWSLSEFHHIKSCLRKYLPNYLEQINERWSKTNYVISNLKHIPMHRGWNIISPHIKTLELRSIEKSVIHSTYNDSYLDLKSGLHLN